MTDTWTGRRPPDGFTLLEVLICMGLILIALLAVYRLQARNLDLQSEARFVTLARYLAQDRIAVLMNDASLGAGKHSGGFGEEFPNLNYEEEISEAGDTAGLLKVRLRILQENPVREFAAETYLFRKTG